MSQRRTRVHAMTEGCGCVPWFRPQADAALGGRTANSQRGGARPGAGVHQPIVCGGVGREGRR